MNKDESNTQNSSSPTKLIGVDLGGTNVRAGRIDEGGGVVAWNSMAISAKAEEGTVIDEICESIREVLGPGVSGIGIGVPSVVDVEKGIVYAVENIPSWQAVPLKDILERRFNIPVYVNNDANCFALGELHSGVGRGYKDLVGLIVGTGMGAGIVTNGRLYCGANCGAGEIGTIPYKEKTIEYYCSGQFFQREYGIDGATLHQQAIDGDPQAQERLAAFGDDFGHAIMTVLYAYDPQIIVLGGSVSNAFPYFEATMRRKLQSYAYQHALERLVIAKSQNPHIAVLGAAALCLDA
jgi:glucokinase